MLSTTTRKSIDPAEIGKFSALAAQWWNPAGSLAPLHRINPIRLGFIRDTCISHFGRNRQSLRPFEGLTLLDIGCGGGLLSEPMSRLGFAVVGADASEENVKIAGAHALETGIAIDYRCVTAEELVNEGRRFDVLLNMEVVEHVADLPAYLEACGRLVGPGGLMFVATINKTLKSLALAKFGAEFILRWVPVGTHDWNRFVEPERLQNLLELAGLKIVKAQGVVFDPLAWIWRLSRDTDVNYMIVAKRD